MPSSPSSTPAPGAWCRASGTRRMPSMRSTSSSSITCGSPDLRFAAGHLHHEQFVGVQLQGGELAAPDRAGVDGMHAMADEQAQRAPVAADAIKARSDTRRVGTVWVWPCRTQVSADHNNTKR